jgi:hypothetical protein
LTGAFFACAAVVQLLALARRLPRQNVLACAAVIWTPTFVVLGLGANYSALLGRIHFAAWSSGSSGASRLPWQIPLLGVLWIALVLGARETLRTLLRPWRRDKYYGYALLIGTVLLVLTADLALQPFGAHVLQWWTWVGDPPRFAWHGAPLQCFATSTVLALLAALFAIPWLIPKRPVALPPDSYPLTAWLAVQLFFTIPNAVHQRWSAVALTLLTSAALTLGFFFAARAGTNPRLSPS